MEDILDIEAMMSDFDIDDLDNIGSFGNVCEERINSAELNKLFDRSSGVLSKRKALCEALGIGESTLSGWLKEDRIPRMAKLVIGIVLLTEGESQHSDYKVRELEEIAYGPRIVQDGDTFMVVKFEKTKWSRETAKTRHLGKVLARGIPDQESAENLVSYKKLQNTLILAAEALAPRANDLPEEVDSGFEHYVMNEIGNQVRDLMPVENANALFGEKFRRTVAEDASQTDQTDKSDDE